MRASVFTCICLASLKVFALNSDVDYSMPPWSLMYGPDISLVVGGKKAEEGQFPWQVAFNLGNTLVCGGMVLSRIFVLTAGHCLRAKDYARLKLIFGSISRNDGNVTRHVAEMLIHEDFFASKERIVNDVGLARLDAPLPDQWTNLLRPIRLPTRAQTSLTLDGEMTLLSGWGRTSLEDYGGPVSLLWVSMPVLPLAECDDKMVENFHVHVNRTHICTDTSNGQSAFQGDSGGPLAWQDPDGVYRVVGIVSFGSPSAKPGVPNVYTRVSQFLDWIAAHSDVTVEE